MLKFEKMTDYQDETILRIECTNKNDYLSDEVSLNLQRMLGYNKALMLDQGWGLTNQYQSLPISAIEKQVYESHNIIKLLTDKRQIIILQLRPIDQLVSLLKQIVQGNPDYYSLEYFEDFSAKFALEEVCSMLVQIVSDGSSG